METKIYNQEGKEVSKISLPENIFGLPWNADLVHQVVVGMMSNSRAGTSHTKDRSEVRGGGKKPWQQKGTGRARHGSSRSPIWVGGGTTFGPRAEKSYKKKINKKMKSKAFLTALSKKLKEGQLFFVDKIEMKEIKTKDAVQVISSLSKIPGLEKMKTNKKRQNCLSVFQKDLSVKKSFSNLPSIYISSIKDLNPVDLLNCKNIIIANPEESIDFLKTKLTAKN